MTQLKQQLTDLQSRLREATASGGGRSTAPHPYGPEVDGTTGEAAAEETGGGIRNSTAAWRRWHSVKDFPRDRPLFVSFSNAHYSDLMMNWVETLRVLDVRQSPPSSILYVSAQLLRLVF